MLPKASWDQKLAPMHIRALYGWLSCVFAISQVCVFKHQIGVQVKIVESKGTHFQDQNLTGKHLCLNSTSGVPSHPAWMARYSRCKGSTLAIAIVIGIISLVMLTIVNGFEGATIVLKFLPESWYGNRVVLNIGFSLGTQHSDEVLYEVILTPHHIRILPY